MKKIHSSTGPLLDEWSAEIQDLLVDFRRGSEYSIGIVE
jgi:hypothetical protein